MSAAERLRGVREGPRTEAAILAVFVVGVIASAVHWAGLVVAGALLGLVAVSTGRAFVLGVYFGAFVLGTYGVVLAWHGTLGSVATAFPLSLGILAVSVVLPTAAATIVRFGTRLDTEG
ncbi:hypothetical protein [Natronomonas gomsonensis]|uniref:hypothetical protein n=1 Tax=Natronomonas gomsonensis TaxID=1046043 RepID=UPI0015BAA25D|nr:hypothetical protein [Natronomonas gomsonensis]